mmetsp:Transcript_39493/g.95457  ORF Transcript_39493/g.95457 Transcript_39493/m.95457 type:complete len:415 (-) Transcript_39493:243-1487(-)
MDDSKKRSTTDNNSPPGPAPAAKKASLTNNTDAAVGASTPSASASSMTTTTEKKQTKSTESRINYQIGRIQNEFRGVPNSPIWLNIATFLEKDERHRIFPSIPELNGIERLADAVVDSQNVMKYIKDCDDRPCGYRYYYVHQCNLSKLFPEGYTQFVNDFSDRTKAVPPEKPKPPLKPEPPEEINFPDGWCPKVRSLYAKANIMAKGTYDILMGTYDFQMETYRIKMKAYEAQLNIFNDMTSCDHHYMCYAYDRIGAIMKGKDESLYYAKDPVTMLDVSVSSKNDCASANKNLKTVNEEDIGCGISIAVPTELWVMFGFKGLGWCPGNKQFEEFCALAGIENPSENEIIAFNGQRDCLQILTWISKDRKVLICMQGDGYRFGCTAERSRGKFLYEWIEKNGNYDEWNPSYRGFV